MIDLEISDRLSNTIKILSMKSGNKKIAIVDVDNTIADNMHRLYCSDDGTLLQEDFLLPEHIKQDPPYPHSIEVLTMLFEHGFELIFLTGRPEYRKEETEKWLFFNNFPAHRNLICKSAKDEESGLSDNIFKYRIVKYLIKKLDKTISLAFDDNERTVAMYEKNNIPVIQIRHFDDWYFIKKWISILWKE